MLAGSRGGGAAAAGRGGGGGGGCTRGQRFDSSRAHYERFADTDRRARVAPCAAIAAVAVAVAVATGRQVEMRQEVISREEMGEGARDQRPR